MKKQQMKKLVLNKSTIENLSLEETNGVKGGRESRILDTACTGTPTASFLAISCHMSCDCL